MSPAEAWQPSDGDADEAQDRALKRLALVAIVGALVCATLFGVTAAAISSPSPASPARASVWPLSSAELVELRAACAPLSSTTARPRLVAEGGAEYPTLPAAIRRLRPGCVGVSPGEVSLQYGGGFESWAVIVFEADPPRSKLAERTRGAITVEQLAPGIYEARYGPF